MLFSILSGFLCGSIISGLAIFIVKMIERSRQRTKIIEDILNTSEELANNMLLVSEQVTRRMDLIEEHGALVVEAFKKQKTILDILADRIQDIGILDESV